MHTKTQKGTKKTHKSNIKWMGIVHVSVSGCGPNHYVSSWSVGWLVGRSVGQSVGRQSSSWSVGQSSSQLVGRSVGRSVGQSVGRQSSSWSVGQSSSQLVGRSVGQSVGRQSSRSVGRMSSRKCLLAIPGEGWGPHSMPRPAQMRKPLRLFNFFIT